MRRVTRLCAPCRPVAGRPEAGDGRPDDDAHHGGKSAGDQPADYAAHLFLPVLFEGQRVAQLVMPHGVFMHGVAPAAGMVVGRADAAVGQLIVRGQVQDLLPGGGGFVIAAIELQRAGLVQQLREAGRAQNVDGCAGDVQDIELAAAVHVYFAGKLVLAPPDAAAAKYEQEVAVLVILIDPACTLVDGGDCAVVVNRHRHKARRLLPGAPALTENFVLVELLLEALVDEDIGANGG